jgi:hypothetical protein
MKHSPALAPSARITLSAHPSAPARVEVVYQPVLDRATRSLASLLICWGLIPVAVFVPPHYPWVIALLAFGGYFAHRYWTGRYVVQAFSGSCPRCGRALELGAGTRIDLPHTLTCFGCHHEPVLEVVPAPLADTDSPFAALVHRDANCTGGWGNDRAAQLPYLTCRGCGARHPATPAAQQAANRENEAGCLLEQLTREGQSLL